LTDTVAVSAADIKAVSAVFTLAMAACGPNLDDVPGFSAAMQACIRMACAAEAAGLPADPVSGNKALAIAYHEMLSDFTDAGFERHEAFRMVEIQAQATAQLGLMRAVHG
jgi:hypothetical protein